MMGAHDGKRGESLAGWFHVAFAALYVLAFVFHLKGAREHFREARKAS